MEKTQNFMKSLRVSHKSKSMRLCVGSGHEQLLYQGTFFNRKIWGKLLSSIT